jgi:hypothetical protein
MGKIVFWPTTNLSYDQPSGTNWVRKSRAHCTNLTNIRVRPAQRHRSSAWSFTLHRHAVSSPFRAMFHPLDCKISWNARPDCVAQPWRCFTTHRSLLQRRHSVADSNVSRIRQRRWREKGIPAQIRVNTGLVWADLFGWRARRDLCLRKAYCGATWWRGRLRQPGSSRVRFPMVSLKFFTDLILWPVFYQPLTEMSNRSYVYRPVRCEIHSILGGLLGCVSNVQQHATE